MNFIGDEDECSTVEYNRAILTIVRVKSMNYDQIMRPMVCRVF